MAAGVLILLGFQWTPRELGWDAAISEGVGHPFLLVLLLVIVLAPAIPLALMISREVWGSWLKRGLAGWLIALSVTFAMLSLFIVEWSTTGDDRMLKAHVGALVLGTVGMLLRASERTLLSRFTVGKMLVGLAAVAGTWSLLTIGAVAAAARHLAAGNSYCLLRSDLEPVQSNAELRGFSFYGTEDREEPTFAGHFNGLLVVATQDGRHDYFEWSPLNWHFEPLDDFSDENIEPGLGCKPVPAFLSGLAII